MSLSLSLSFIHVIKNTEREISGFVCSHCSALMKITIEYLNISKTSIFADIHF